MGINPEKLYEYQKEHSKSFNESEKSGKENMEVNQKKSKERRGLEDVPELSDIYVDYPIKVFPADYVGGERAA